MSGRLGTEGTTTVVWHEGGRLVEAYSASATEEVDVTLRSCRDIDGNGRAYGPIQHYWRGQVGHTVVASGGPYETEAQAVAQGKEYARTHDVYRRSC